MPNKNKIEPDSPKNESEAPVKLFDVAGPGKTPALATSRPVIVGHGSMVTHDPMVVNESVEKVEAPKAPVAVTHELKIQPDTPAEATSEPAEVIAVSEQPTDAPKEDTVSSEESETSEPASASEPAKAEASEGSAVNTLANEVDAKQADKKEKQEREERAKALEKTIAAKEYFVPIGLESRRRSNNRILLLLILVIVMGVAGLNFAIDADMLDIGIEALTDLL